MHKKAPRYRTCSFKMASALRADFGADAQPSLPTLAWAGSGASRARQLVMWLSAARPKTLTAAVVPWLVVRVDKCLTAVESSTSRTSERKIFILTTIPASAKREPPVPGHVARCKGRARARGFDVYGDFSLSWSSRQPPEAEADHSLFQFCKVAKRTTSDEIVCCDGWTFRRWEARWRCRGGARRNGATPSWPWSRTSSSRWAPTWSTTPATSTAAPTQR